MKFTSDSAEGKVPNKTIDNLHVHDNEILGGSDFYDKTAYAIYSKHNVPLQDVVFENNIFEDYINGRGTIRIDSTYAEPTIRFNGDGNGAEGYATLKVIDVVILNPGSGYTDISSNIISDIGGTGASIVLSHVDGKIIDATVEDNGSGYRKRPKLSLSSSSGQDAYVSLVMGIDKIVITNGGNGYSYATISVSGSGGYSFEGTVNLNEGSVSSVTVTNSGREYGRGSNVIFRNNKITLKKDNSPEQVIQMSGQNININNNTIDMEKHFPEMPNSMSYSMIGTPIYASNTNIVPIEWNFINNTLNANNTYGNRNKDYYAIEKLVRGGNYEGIRIENNTIKGIFLGDIIKKNTTSNDYIEENNDVEDANTK